MNAANDGAATYLYLLRHGATEANERVPFILQGSGIDLPLSPTGIRQAEHLAEFLSQQNLTRVYSSAMRRARQTAEAIAARCRIDTAPLEHLQECHVGAWEGMDWGRIRREFPEAHAAFVDRPDIAGYLQGESYRDVDARAFPVIDWLLRHHPGERIAVVAHNVVNRVILAKLLGLELRKAQSLRQANCCVNLIRRHDGRTEVVTYNSQFHLGGAPG